MYEIMKEQSELVKEIHRRKKETEQKKEDGTKTSTKMSLFGFS